MNKVDYINYMLENIIEEKSNIDLLTMGSQKALDAIVLLTALFVQE